MLRVSLQRLVPALLLALGARSGANAQETGTIRGAVIDGYRLEALPGTSVRIDGTAVATETDRTGNFELEHVPVGEVVIVVEREGHTSLRQAVGVRPGDTTLVQFGLLPLYYALEGMLVEAGRDPDEARRYTAPSRISSESSDDMLTALDLLARQLPGILVSRSTRSVGASPRLRLRGSNSVSLGTLPAIYVDGVRIIDRASAASPRDHPGLRALELIPASAIRSIRVLRGPAASIAYGESSNGVIVIETIRKRDGGD